jgi:DNA-binding protein H-NS
MITDKFNSMSVDELWSLREEIRALLSSKMLEEKTRLETKLNELRAEAPPRSEASSMTDEII